MATIPLFHYRDAQRGIDVIHGTTVLTTHKRKKEKNMTEKSFNDEHSRLTMTHILGMRLCARIELETLIVDLL